MINEPWTMRASCATEDPNIFFPATYGIDKIKQAVRICGHCPVRQQCLHYAIEVRIPYGIFGGTTPSQRGTTPQTVRGTTPSQRGGLRKHGTLAAVKRHYRHKEELCGPCRIVERERSANYKKRRKERISAAAGGR